MNNGFFKDNEYIITNMRPIRPLMNYLWSQKVVGNIDQTGQGMALACIESNRRTFVKSKRYFYLKNKETGLIYSPNRNFENLPFDVYECHVGLGYQKIISEFKGIRVEMTFMIPEDNYVELVKVVIKNNSNKVFRGSSYYYCDLDANLTVHFAYGKGYFDKELGGLAYPHYHFDAINDYNMMFAKSSDKLLGFDVCNNNFFGTYGNEIVPDGIKKERLSSQESVFEEFYCAAIQNSISLNPGEEKAIIYIVGIEKTIKSAKVVSDKYLSLNKFNNELKRQMQKNEKYQNIFVCKTPDSYFDVMTNIWLKRQLSLGKTWGRVYGKGFRDVLQDIAAFVSLDPTLAKQQIITALSHQYESGNAIRMYEPDFKYPYYDMPAWIPATVIQYIKETGDFSILDEIVPYLDSELKEDILSHIKRGMDFLIINRGKHNLILWGGGDWNDSMNNAGMKLVGESVWLSIATIKALNEFIELLRRLKNKEELIEKYKKERNKLVEAVERYGWDKNHYIYGYADNGEKVGANENKEGKIYLNPQTWAVLANLKDKKEANELMDFVEDNLQCDFGYLLNTPTYQKGIEYLGRSTYFIPGLIENGSVYNHGVAFKIVADCLLGRADKAYQTFLKMRYDNPLNPNSGVEPYAFSNMYIGPDSPSKKGFAPMFWVTGTAGWMYRAFTENIIGISPDYNGLIIAPNIPSNWNEAKATRIYRGATYNVEIKRDTEKGIFYNNKKLPSNKLPLLKEGETGTFIVNV